MQIERREGARRGGHGALYADSRSLRAGHCDGSVISASIVSAGEEQVSLAHLLLNIPRELPADLLLTSM